MPRKKQETKTEEKVLKPTLKSYECIIKPILTEKTTKLLEEENKVTLQVKKNSNKEEIKDAFQALFGVKVKKVNVMNVRAKAKRVGKYSGTKPGYKKAIVTLEEGQASELLK